jgi:hypothetical protein
MATEEAEAPEGFTEVDSNSDNDGDTPTVELSPGESLTGIVLELRDVGYNGLMVFRDDDDGDRKEYWLNGQVASRFDAADVEPGDEVHIVKTTEERTYEDDGEEVPYNVFKVYVK